MTAQPTSKDLLGGAAAGVKFESPGDMVEGIVISWLVKPVTKMGTGEIDTFPSGDPKYQIIVTLQTTLRNDIDDDGKRTVYIKSHMMSAFKTALAATGADDLEKGAWTRIIYTGLGEAQRGLNPPKMFTAEYKRPSAQVLAGQVGPGVLQQAVGNVQAGLGGQAMPAAQPVQQDFQPPVQPAPMPQGVGGYGSQPYQQNPQGYPLPQQSAPVQQQAPAVPQVNITPELLASLEAANIDIEAFKASLGVQS